MAVLHIPVGWLGEGVNVPNEVGFKKLNRLFTVIQLLFVVCFLGGQVLLEVMGVGLRGDDQSVDDGSVGVSGKIVAGDCAAD